MNKFKAIVMGLIGLSSVANAAEVKMEWFESNGEAFKIQAPSNWKKNSTEQYLQVMSPDGSVVITIYAYGKNGGSLEEFAQFRFSSIEEFYKAQSGVQTLKNGSFMEYEGTWPGEQKPTYYVVAATSRDNAYFSINLVTEKSDFEHNKSLYTSIFESADLVKKPK